MKREGGAGCRPCERSGGTECRRVGDYVLTGEYDSFFNKGVSEEWRGQVTELCPLGY